MAIPSVSELSTPLLELLADQKEHSLDEVKDRLVKTYQLSENDRTKVFQNRPRRIFDTRVIQAISYLRNEGLLENKGRGVFKITKSGVNKLK